MADILNIATKGLMAFRTAMATTGHNVANVNTPFYSRQRVDLGTPLPEQQSFGFLGRGVDIESVTRAYDDFILKQLRGHASGVNQYEKLNDLTGQMSALLGDADVGLTPDLEAFFGALQDLADSPTSITARQVFLDEAQTLVTRTQDINSALGDLRNSVDNGIRNAVTTINDLSTAIAQINRDLLQATDSPTNSPNDLLDRRDRLLVDLSKLVGIQAVTQEDGTLNVFMNHGQPLVVGTNTIELLAVRSGFDPDETTVRLEGQAEGSDLERYIVSGELGGYFEFRRDILNQAQDTLGLLAVGVTETFNEQNRKGMDLNGNLGSDLFNVGSPKVLAHTINKGNAVFTASLNNEKAPYELSYDGTDYRLTRLSDGVIVADNFALTSNTTPAVSIPLTIDGITVELTSGTLVNNGDRFLLQPNSQGTAAVSYNGNNAASNVQFKSTVLPTTDSSKLVRSNYEILNSGVASRPALTNRGNATISAPTVIDVNNANLTNTVRIRFTAPAVYDVIDATTGTVLAGGQAYVSGATIPPAGNYNGWTVQITNGTPPIPIVAGDTFEISAGYTVKRLSDDQEILSNGDLIKLNDVLRGEGLNIELTGGPPKYGDRFLLQPTRNSSAGFEMIVDNPRELAAAAPITTGATATNLGSGIISAGKVIDSNRTTLQNQVEIRFTSDNTFNVFDLGTNTLLDKGVAFPPIAASANSSNSGNAVITKPVVADYTDSRLRNTLEVRFISATRYEVIDITTGETLTPAGGTAYTSGNPIGPHNGLTFQISGTPISGDSFQVRSTTNNPISYNGWEINITGAPHGDIIAVPETDNLGTATIEAPIITDYQADNLTNTVEIRFLTATDYEIVDITTGETLTALGGVPYVSGGVITPPNSPSTGLAYGWTVKINGLPQAGDKFQIKNDGDTFQIKSNKGGIGDNRNALELVKLQTQPQFLGGNDYRGIYAQMIAEVGAQGRRIDNTLQSQEALLQQSELSRESLSGVSLDEEAADLVRFQQAYQAAAQVIQTSNSLFSSLLEAVRG